MTRLFYLAGLVLFFTVGITEASDNKAYKKPQPTAKNGVIDISNWDFKKSGAIQLKGEWEFYWKELLEPEDFKDQKTLPPKRMIIQPTSWNLDTLDGTTIESKGYATYRLLIKVAAAGEPLGLNIPQIYTAYRLWLNGDLIDSVGEVGKSLEASSPAWHPTLLTLSPAKEIELVLQVSNFDFRTGGMPFPLSIGIASEQLLNSYWKVSQGFFLSGVLIIIGLYNIMIYFFRKKELAFLYFGIFCLLETSRHLTTSIDPQIFWIFPDTSWEASTKISLISNLLGNPIFILFIKELFPKEFPGRFPKIYFMIAAFLTLIMLFTPARIANPAVRAMDIPILLGSIYALRGGLKALYNGRQGSLLALAGGLFLFIAVVHDIAIEYEASRSAVWIPTGIFVFILSYSLILAKRFAQAFNIIEKQKASLIKINLELEDKVEERTKKLKGMLTEKEILLKEIHHRVKNNMQVIQSLLNLQGDYLNDEKVLLALSESKNRIKSMMLIHENLYLSENLSEVNMGSYFQSLLEYLFESYGIDEDKIEFKVNAKSIFMNTDNSLSLGLVVIELVSNSLKHAFTQTGCGNVEINFTQDKNNYTLTVSDDGSGIKGGINTSHEHKLGMRLIMGLVEKQLRGSITYDGNNGSLFNIELNNMGGKEFE